jgi:hypothetical protein
LRAAFAAGFIALCAVATLSLLVAAGANAAPGEAAGQASSQASGPALGDVAGSIFGAPAHSDPLSFDAIIAAQDPLTCTLATTTTSDVVGNYSFATAVDLINVFNNLSLAPGNLGQVVTVNTQYFRLPSAIVGMHYIVEGVPNGVGNYNLGIIVYDAAFTPVLTDTNALDNSSARVDLLATNIGPYYFAVSHISPVCPSGTYRLTTTGPATATPTPTRTPTPTGSPTGSATATPTGLVGADRFEPNFDFDRASLIALNVEYTALNFVPWSGADPNQPDNDFYKVWVKPGQLVTCETLKLSAYTDTNLILYDNNRNGIGGNEDIDRSAGNLASRLSYYVTYEGWLYALIGNVYPIDNPSQAFNFTYSFQCFTGTGPTSTPTATSPPVTRSPTSTPTPSPSLTSSPTSTPTPPFIQVRLMPTATPAGQRGVLVPLSLQVYYDVNNNRVPDPGEGIVAISSRVVDVTTGQELAHGFTDEFGFASLTVNASGVVRLVVPYLNYSVLVQPSGSSIALRVAPHSLPNAIP